MLSRVPPQNQGCVEELACTEGSLFQPQEMHWAPGSRARSILILEPSKSPRFPRGLERSNSSAARW